MKANTFLLASLAILLSIVSVSAYNQTNYTANATYTVPTNIQYILVEGWGAGGGGGGSAANANAGAAGGGGGSYAASIISVTTGQNFTIIVGTGGTGGAAGANQGNNGTATIFHNGTIYLYAEPGRGGAAAGGTPTGGYGGNRSNNTGNVVSWSGGKGGDGAAGAPAVGFSGGGGGSAGDWQNGYGPTSSATNLSGGRGGTRYGGEGGQGWTSDSAGTTPATLAGGGSGAYCDGSCTAKAGGSGANGRIAITAYNSTDQMGLLAIYLYYESTLANITEVTVNDTISPFDNSTPDLTQNTATGFMLINNLPSTTYTNHFLSNVTDLRSYITTISTGTLTTLYAYLTGGTSSVTLQILDSQNGAQLEGAAVTIARSLGGSFTTVSSQYTDVTGTVEFNYVPYARYRFTISLDNYQSLLFYLDPILLSSYQVKLTSDTASYLNNTLDYAGLSLIVTPRTFYNQQQNNVTYIIASPNGTLTQYGINITYPNATSTYVNIDDAGINANGETLELAFNISTNNIYDTVNITYSYTTTNTGYREYGPFSYSIQNVTSTGLLTSNCSEDYGMGGLERTIIAIIIILVIAGVTAPVLGAEAAGLLALFMLGFLVKICFVPWWAAAISVLVGAATLIAYGGRR